MHFPLNILLTKVRNICGANQAASVGPVEHPEGLPAPSGAQCNSPPVHCAIHKMQSTQWNTMQPTCAIHTIQCNPDGNAIRMCNAQCALCNPHNSIHTIQYIATQLCNATEAAAQCNPGAMHTMQLSGNETWVEMKCKPSGKMPFVHTTSSWFTTLGGSCRSCSQTLKGLHIQYNHFMGASFEITHPQWPDFMGAPSRSRLKGQLRREGARSRPWTLTKVDMGVHSLFRFWMQTKCLLTDRELFKILVVGSVGGSGRW